MERESHDILVVMVTAPNQEEAARIADQAVRSRHAACATTIPAARSTYWWEGQVVSEQETVLLMKTTADRFPLLQDTIRKVHSYKVPEIIALPVTDGLPQYLEWVRTETS
ncbi:MAG: divalent-cation tolerance protein CutA [Nitrospira sp.]|nr:divalent-cation tolerance protein CutA [Nitrospira sp.]